MSKTKQNKTIGRPQKIIPPIHTTPEKLGKAVMTLLPREIWDKSKDHTRQYSNK